MNKEFEARHNEALQILSILSKEAERIDENIVFLGGSAVQAILANPKRLSIDLDVYYSGSAEKLIAVLESHGYRNKLRKSRNPELFEFYTAQKGEVIVKMDFMKPKVPEKYSYKKDLVAMQGKTFAVQIGKPEYLMAAKLSTLAVGTIGRIEKSETLGIDIVKDVFDFNCLLDEFPGLNLEISEAFNEIIDIQNKLRKTSYTMEEIQESLEKTLKAMARFGKDSSITQGVLGNFSQHLYAGEFSRSELVIAAMRTLYHTKAIRRKENADNGEELAKQKETDRAYVSECERKLIATGEEPDLLHELKIKAPKALIYFYFSKFASK